MMTLAQAVNIRRFCTELEKGNIMNCSWQFLVFTFKMYILTHASEEKISFRSKKKWKGSDKIYLFSNTKILYLPNAEIENPLQVIADYSYIMSTNIHV